MVPLTHLHGSVEHDVAEWVALVYEQTTLRTVILIIQVFNYTTLTERVQAFYNSGSLYQVS